MNLHTHNDEREILPVDQLPSMFVSSSSEKGQGFDHTHWSPAWVIKYSSIIRLRGIIAHKGYVDGRIIRAELVNHVTSLQVSCQH